MGSTVGHHSRHTLPGGPVVQRPEASMLLYHLAQQHMDQLRPYLQRMETECITTVVVDAYEVVEQKGDSV